MGRVPIAAPCLIAAPRTLYVNREYPMAKHQATAAQICTGHWRSAEYLKRTRKRTDDRCWLCQKGRGPRMTRSHVLLHCPSERPKSARAEAWEGKNPGGTRVLLPNPRWERRLLLCLELSGVGRTMAMELMKMLRQWTNG